VGTIEPHYGERDRALALPAVRAVRMTEIVPSPPVRGRARTRALDRAERSSLSIPAVVVRDGPKTEVLK